MATEVTNYIVRTKYEVQGAPDATRKVDDVGKAADRASSRFADLRRSMMGIGAMALGGGGLFLAKKALIDFNASLEDSRATMAGLLMMNVGGTFSKNQEKANALVDRFLVRAKETSASFSDLQQMAVLVTSSVSAAGGSMKQLEDITVGASVAAKALGRETGDAGREIGQLLAGRVEAVDVFGRQLLRTVGYNDYQAFNKLSEKKRLEITVGALDQPALRAMAKAQANSFSGATAAFKDNLQLALGKVGLPLMKEITAEVKQWNAWIDQHPEKIAALVKDVGQGLKDGFSAVKSAVMWIADNRDTLLALAKAALVLKAGGIAGELVGGPLRAMASLSERLDKAAKPAATFAERATAAANKLGLAVNVLAGVYAGASFVAGHLLRERDREIARQVSADSSVDFAWRNATGTMRTPGAAGLKSRLDDAMAAGLLKVDKGGRFSVDARRVAAGVGREGEFDNARFWGHQYIPTLKELIASNHLLALAQKQAVDGYKVALNKGWMAQAELFAGMVREVTDKAVNFDKQIKAGDTNIKIAKVEVAAKDPDRWIQTLEKETRKRARHPTRARAALRGGGA